MLPETIDRRRNSSPEMTTTIQTTTIQTTTTTTPFSVSLEDIYIYIYRGFVDTFSRRRNKGFGERSELVLDSDISS